MSLTLQFVPYGEIEHLDSTAKVNKLIKIVKEEKIILLEGRIEKNEETLLIKRTMEEIGPKFKGIELFVMYPKDEENDPLQRLKKGIVDMLLGNRQGLTIIGPATIVKEIRKDPDKIQLLTKNLSSKRKKTPASRSKSTKKAKTKKKK
jgi:hypothetical protein